MSFESFTGIVCMPTTCTRSICGSVIAFHPGLVEISQTRPWKVLCEVTSGYFDPVRVQTKFLRDEGRKSPQPRVSYSTKLPRRDILYFEKCTLPEALRFSSSYLVQCLRLGQPPISHCSKRNLAKRLSILRL